MAGKVAGSEETQKLRDQAALNPAILQNRCWKRDFHRSFISCILVTLSFS